MKKIISIVLLVIFLMTVTSCDDRLSRKSLSEYSDAELEARIEQYYDECTPWAMRETIANQNELILRKLE